MKPLSPQAQKALLDYRREHALPPSLRGRLLEELVRKRKLEDASGLVEHAPSSPAQTRRFLRVLRWAGPTSVLMVGLGLWFYPASLGVLPAHGRARFDTPARNPSAAATGELAVPTYGLPASSPPVPASPSGFALTPAPRSRSADKPRAGRSAFKQVAPSRPTPTPVQEAADRVDVLLVRGTARFDSVQEPQSVPDREAPPATSLPFADRPSSQTIAPVAARSGVATSQAQSEQESRPRPSLDEEVMQMRTAYDHLRAGEPLRALSALSEHARRFPDGKLVTMRKVARIQALCDLGKRSDASEEAERFLDAHGDSPYAARVRQVCIPRSAPPK